MNNKQKVEFIQEFKKHFPNVLDIDDAILWTYRTPVGDSNDLIWFGSIKLEAINRLSDEQLIKLRDLCKELVTYS